MSGAIYLLLLSSSGLEAFPNWDTFGALTLATRLTRISIHVWEGSWPLNQGRLRELANYIILPQAFPGICRKTLASDTLSTE